MKQVVLSLFLLTMASASELPDAPHLSMSAAVTLDPNVVHNTPSFSPKAPRNLDWRFLTAHGVYASAVAFDGLVTAKGLGRPCGFVEGNTDLGQNPSVKKIAIYSLVEFSAVTAMDYVFKRTRMPGLSYIGASIGTIKHVHGGTQWVKDCF